MKIKHIAALLLVVPYGKRLLAQTLPTAPIYSYTVPSSGGYASNGNLVNYRDQITGSWTMQYIILSIIISGVG